MTPSIWFRAPELLEFQAHPERKANRSVPVLAYDHDHARRQAAARLGVPPDRIEIVRVEARLEGSERA